MCTILSSTLILSATGMYVFVVMRLPCPSLNSIPRFGKGIYLTTTSSKWVAFEVHVQICVDLENFSGVMVTLAGTAKNRFQRMEEGRS
jgi:hypothetical protein